MDTSYEGMQLQQCSISVHVSLSHSLFLSSVPLISQGWSPFLSPFLFPSPNKKVLKTALTHDAASLFLPFFKNCYNCIKESDLLETNINLQGPTLTLTIFKSIFYKSMHPARHVPKLPGKEPSRYYSPCTSSEDTNWERTGRLSSPTCPFIKCSINP